MENIIYITTAHTGYNYGTYLQAYAMKQLMCQFANQSEIVWEKSFGPKGRDFRIKKIITLCIRSLLHYKQFSAIKQGYSKNFATEPSEKTKAMFDSFSEKYLGIKEYNNYQLRKLSNESKTKAVVCGSDQIWNASSMYPDPLYYLQFAPKNKRIAYAPSFGRNEVPKYNHKRIKQYINSIPNASVREASGAKIIKELTGKDVPVMPDPTIVVNWGNWIKSNKENYIVLYFLDEPNSMVIEEIKSIQEEMKAEIKVLFYTFDSFHSLNNSHTVDAGPKEFVEMISKAIFVCTDSFHATIFSILSSTPFYVYERNYGKVANQSSRIENLLNHYCLMDRIRNHQCAGLNIKTSCDFSNVEVIRNGDIECARNYLKLALCGGC